MKSGMCRLILFNREPSLKRCLVSGGKLSYQSTEQSKSSDAMSAEKTFESALEDWILSSLPSSSFFFVAWDNCCDDRELR